ncbi:MAG: hypothetical protein A3F74_18090 [Betaproteobacteria bacterium RIFCSPLOWO2_12_FULL_62_58]|nr:MAG: hypothetical protein A3F74_18090 [Betaproteobacteria bacterium RIFCSPLOWO2_12_FULL_62_58]
MAVDLTAKAAPDGYTIAVIAIDTLEVVEGGLPKRALALVVEWAQQRRDELREDWRLAEMHQALKPIPALV